MLRRETTGRGFTVFKFKDRNAEECTLQKSSLATEDAIWFGTRGRVVCSTGLRWEDAPLPPGAQVLSRMHLSQEQVRQLLPLLTRFAETGELPGEHDDG